MPSLNLDIDYFNHPKTKRLVRLLGKGSEVIPLRLWCFTARYFAKDGRLTGTSAQEIEGECHWWGASGDAIKAMMDPLCVFLELDGKTYVVHDWLEHEGHIIAFQERAKAGAEERWRRYREKKDDASSIASSNAPTVPTKPTKPNQPSGVPPGFEKFWEEWPAHFRKKGREKCLAHWDKHKLEAIAAKIISAVQAWKKSDQWSKDEGQFIPGPLPWLNQQTYNAALPPVNGSKSGHKLPESSSLRVRM